MRHTLLLCSLVCAAAAGYAQPSGGPYGPIDQRYEIPKAAHVYYVAPDGKADAPGTTLDRADHARGGDRARRHRRRHRDARRRLPHRRPGPQPGHHAAALRRRTPDPQGHPGGDKVGDAAQQRLEDLVDTPLPGRAPRLVAARPRGHAHAAAPVQQRHGVRGRRTAEVGGLGGRARRPFLLHRLPGRLRLHRHRSHEPAGRDHRVRQRAGADQRRGARQDQRSQRPDHPRDHVHAVRLPRARGRGQEAASRADEEPTDEPVGLADPATYRQGGRSARRSRT